jgi:hypothetical protein
MSISGPVTYAVEAKVRVDLSPDVGLQDLASHFRFTKLEPGFGAVRVAAGPGRSVVIHLNGTVLASAGSADDAMFLCDSVAERLSPNFGVPTVVNVFASASLPGPLRLEALSKRLGAVYDRNGCKAARLRAGEVTLQIYGSGRVLMRAPRGGLFEEAFTSLQTRCR